MFARLTLAPIAAATAIAFVLVIAPTNHVQSARAGQTVIGTTDRGFYMKTESDPRGTFHEPDNLGYKTGAEVDGGQHVNFRSFFYFHLPAQSEQLLKVQLQLFEPASGYHSDNAKETLSVYDVTTDVPTVLAGGEHKEAIWSDLGSGVKYGSKDVTISDNNNLVTIDMGAPFVSMIQTGGDIMVGAAITSLGSSGPTGETIFNATGPASAAQLLLTTASHQADGWVRVGTSGPYSGDDIHNSDATGQTATTSAKKGKTATFTLKVQNDGEAPEKIAVIGQASTTGFQVKYFKGSKDITAMVTSGPNFYRSRVLAPGASVLITVKVKVLSGAGLGWQSLTQITLEPDGDTSKWDVVRVAVTRV